MTRRTLPILLALVAAGLLTSCKSNSAEQVKPAAASQTADTAPPEDIAPDDPIWDLVAKRQAYLDRVEQNRSGHNDARSCQKAVPAAYHRVKADTSACTQDQLRAEWDAARNQGFDRAAQMMRDRKQ